MRRLSSNGDRFARFGNRRSGIAGFLKSVAGVNDKARKRAAVPEPENCEAIFIATRGSLHERPSAS